MTEKKDWKVPPELAAYDTYTNYPGRAEELINSDATYKNNVIVAAMACEVGAQWNLLARLHRAGLLLHPDDASYLCKECKRVFARVCPNCGACENGCFGGFENNECAHPSAAWKAKETS